MFVSELVVPSLLPISSIIPITYAIHVEDRQHKLVSLCVILFYIPRTDGGRISAPLRRFFVDNGKTAARSSRNLA